MPGKPPVRVRISGIPYAQLKSRGRRDGGPEWSRAVKQQTVHLPPAGGPCRIRVAFFLPANKYPLDHPYGMDLDNLLKRFFDALETTVFRHVPGKDGCITEIVASKVKVSSDAEAGAELEMPEL